MLETADAEMRRENSREIEPITTTDECNRIVTCAIGGGERACLAKIGTNSALHRLDAPSCR